MLNRQIFRICNKIICAQHKLKHVCKVCNEWMITQNTTSQAIDHLNIGRQMENYFLISSKQPKKLRAISNKPKDFI